MKPHQSNPNKQGGSMLLEGLIAILLFSIGILAIVGLQAASIKISGDAKFRSDASLLANQLIGQMWVGDRTPATLQANFSSPNGALYKNWANSVGASLPGVSGVPGAVPNLPTVTFITNTNPIAHSSIATIKIYWISPSEQQNGQPAHQYIAVAEIL
jgi:type IV pilus assembly protein PilV